MAEATLAFNILTKYKDAGANRAARDMSRLEKTSSQFGSTLKRVAIAGAAGLAGVGVAGAAMGLKTAASMEQARISFTTMLGSAGKADSFLKQLANFAAKTPFEFPELQTAASSLIAAGINAKKVIPIMTTLGDVTAGMGTGSEGIKRATIALQQMQAAGKITGEDLNQLRDAGIPVYDLLAKATGKSKAEVVGLAQAGKLGSKELGQMMKALETGRGLERFSGLMDKQAKSLTGQWSTFMDTLNMGLAKAIEPLIPLIKDGLAKASAALANVLPKVAAGLQSFAQGIKDGTGAGGQLRAVLTNMIGAISAVVSWAIRWQAVLVPVAAGILAIVAAVKVWRAVTIAYTVAQAALNVVLLANPIGLIVLAIVGLVAALVVAYKRSETFRNIVNGAFHGVKAVAMTVFNWIKGHWPLLLGMLAGPIGVAVVLIVKHWDRIRSGVSSVLGWIRGNWPKIIAVIAGPVGVAVAMVVKNWDRIRAAASSAFHKVVSLAAGLPGRIKGAVANLGSILYSAGIAVIQGLINGMRAKVGELMGLAGSIASSIKGKITGALGIHSPSRVMIKVGEYIMDGLIGGMRSKERSLKSVLEKVTDLVSAKADQLKTLLSDRNSFATGFRSFTSSVFGQDFTDPESGANTATAAKIVAAQKAQAQKAVALRRDVARLVKMGLSNDLIRQLQASGEGGIAQIHALAQGSTSQVRQLNALNAQTTSNLMAAGMTAGNELYGDSIHDAQKDLRVAKAVAAELRKFAHEHPQAVVHIHGATLASKRELETLVVRALDDIKRKGRG